MNELLAAALHYARQGWPVFPIRPGNKVPLIESTHPLGDPARGVCRGECGRDGHGLYDATTEASRIEAWWKAVPRANIGVRTGVIFDVFDVDAQHDGCRTYAELLDLHGCMPSAPSVATPSGGVHLYFQPNGLPNGAGMRPGLDWRGAGGYVVVPPSRRPDGAYEWGLTPGEFAFAEAPEWLLDLHPRRGQGKPGFPTRPTPRTVTADAYARQALAGEVGKVHLSGEGTRNHTVNAAAFSLGQLVAGGVLDAGEVAEHLLSAAMAVGLSEHEAVATIRSGMSSGMRQPRGVPA